MYKDAFNSVAYAIMAIQDNPSAALGQIPDGSATSRLLCFMAVLVRVSTAVTKQQVGEERVNLAHAFSTAVHH